MAGTLRWTGAIVGFLGVASAAQAFGWGRSSASRSSAAPVAYAPAVYAPAVYVAAPVMAPWLCVPSVPTPRVAPLPRTITPPLAGPKSAPPSGKTTEPPMDPKRAPVIIESRSFGGAFLPQGPGPSAGRCRVGFWNVTGRDVTLTVNGQARPLSKDRALTVELDRTFGWQVDGGAAHAERVPDEQTSFEVIIR